MLFLCAEVKAVCSSATNDRIWTTEKNLMKMLAYIAFIMGAGLGAFAQAEERPNQLVCFARSGLAASLDKVVNAQQFLANDSILQSGSCGFAQIPVGSTARYVGIHANPHGFLYPLYRVTYATSGQKMFAADGVFQADQWKVRLQRRTEVYFLTPASCGVLDGYMQMRNRVPRYIFVPEICDVEIVE
jgi:hypothetical protein